MIYFLDTNICIRILNGSSQNAIHRFEEIDLDEIAIPSIVAAELLYGANKSIKRDHNLAKFRAFLAPLRLAVLTPAAMEAYGEIRAALERKGTPIGANDYFIAAIASANGGVLVTNNTREFSRVDALALEDWTVI